MDLLETITKLSHEFGTCDYVRGGGGNTSAKDSETLWVKPSGTTLPGLTPDTFVEMDRAKLQKLYEVDPPADSSAREALVKETMAAAVKPESSGRPSVEAPLHDTFEATYVVHTHPALVNGMTCAKDGKIVCGELFPEALWMDYVDPGYTLCMEVRKAVDDYRKQHGQQPSLVFLKNHGVFVAADTAQEIRSLYTIIMDRLRACYADAGIKTELSVGAEPDAEAIESVRDTLQEVVGEKDAAVVVASGPFTSVHGPVSPDHIVYMKAYPLVGDGTAEAVAEFKRAKGYAPRIIATSAGCFATGPTEKQARLALELAQDGALVWQLADAFGGLEYMTDRERDFIDNWEVEAYRRKQMED